MFVNLSWRVWIIFRLNFKKFLWRYMLALCLPLLFLLNKVFSKKTSMMICNFGGWHRIYLTTPKAFWTSMLHCFKPAVRFSLEDLLDRAGEMFVVHVFDICNVYKIVAYDWLHSQYWGRVKTLGMVLTFLGNIVDWSLFLVC